MVRVHRIQHVALASRDVAAAHRFYAGRLGLPVGNFDPEGGLLALRLADGFVLRFEAGPAPGVRFLGLELESFEAVDQAYRRFSDRVVLDLRARYRNRPGPYGFFLEDPDGYRVKLFKYGPRR